MITVGAWKELKCAEDFSVLLVENRDGDYIFEGRFEEIPERFLECKVKNNWRILDSEIESRIGGYVLEIEVKTDGI